MPQTATEAIGIANPWILGILRGNAGKNHDFLADVVNYRFTETELFDLLSTGSNYDVLHNKINKAVETQDHDSVKVLIKNYDALQNNGFKLSEKEREALVKAALEHELTSVAYHSPSFFEDLRELVPNQDLERIVLRMHNSLVEDGTKLTSAEEALTSFFTHDYLKVKKDKLQIVSCLSRLIPSDERNVTLERVIGRFVDYTLRHDYDGSLNKESVFNFVMYVGGSYANPAEKVADTLIAKNSVDRELIAGLLEYSWREKGSETAKDKFTRFLKRELRSGFMQYFLEFIKPDIRLSEEERKLALKQMNEDNRQEYTISCIKKIFGELSQGQIMEKLGDMYMLKGKRRLAHQHYVQCDSPERVFKSALKIAKYGQVEEAFKALERIDLGKVDTNNDYFYELIAKSIPYAYTVSPRSFSPKTIKDGFNAKLKQELIQDINLNESDGRVKIAVDVGGMRFIYEKHDYKGESRNEVSKWKETKVMQEQATLKLYNNKEDAKAEAFWTEFLQPFFKQHDIPTRLYQTGMFGKAFNKLQYIEGTALKTEQDYRKALDLGLAMIRHIKDNEEDIVKQLEKRGVHYKLTSDYVDERFDQFEAQLAEANPKLRERLRTERRKIKDALFDGSGNIVPYDYAPRNLLVTKQGLVIPYKIKPRIAPIDLECFMQGNAWTVISSLAVNPESKDIVAYAINDDDAKKYEKDFRLPNEIFWAVRQGRRAFDADKPRFEWYVKAIEERV